MREGFLHTITQYSAAAADVTLLEVPYGGPHYHAAVALRQHVLRSPLGLAYTPDQLGLDAPDRQFMAMLGEKLVGCVMLHAVDAATAKLRQFAVSPNLQGGGIGSKLLAMFEREALAAGYKNVHLSARETAVNFYRKHGYDTQGEGYVQVGLPHIAMVKTF